MGGITEDGREGLYVGEAHGFANSGMVFEADGRDESCDYGEDSCGVDAAWGDSVMGMWMVRGVGAEGFEDVFEIVGDEVEAHEEEEDGHGEAGKDFGALEAERVADAGPFPDFKVAEDVHDYAD